MEGKSRSTARFANRYQRNDWLWMHVSSLLVYTTFSSVRFIVPDSPSSSLDLKRGRLLNLGWKCRDLFGSGLKFRSPAGHTRNFGKVNTAYIRARDVMPWLPLSRFWHALTLLRRSNVSAALPYGVTISDSCLVALTFNQPMGAFKKFMRNEKSNVDRAT